MCWFMSSVLWWMMMTTTIIHSGYIDMTINPPIIQGSIRKAFLKHCAIATTLGIIGGEIWYRGYVLPRRERRTEFYRSKGVTFVHPFEDWWCLIHHLNCLWDYLNKETFLLAHILQMSQSIKHNEIPCMINDKHRRRHHWGFLQANSKAASSQRRQIIQRDGSALIDC